MREDKIMTTMVRGQPPFESGQKLVVANVSWQTYQDMGAHKFYCGVDLHARTMYPCVRDHAGTIVLHKEVPAEPGAFLEAIAPQTAYQKSPCRWLPSLGRES
jgi:hypothetical protein